MIRLAILLLLLPSLVFAQQSPMGGSSSSTAAADPASERVVLMSGVETTVYKIVEEPARFDQLLTKYLSEHVKLPDGTKQSDLTGKAVLRIIVTADGNVEQATIARSSGNTALDAELIRVISVMPAWRAAQVGRSAVASYVTFPIMIDAF